MNIRVFYFLVWVSLLSVTSCKNEEIVTKKIVPPVLTRPELIEGDYVEWNMAPTGTSRLFCGMLDTLCVKDWKFRWFEINDGAATEISGAINNYYDVDFVQVGIKEIKCEVSYVNIVNDSSVTKVYPFHVAYTGLPTLYITTENGQAVENKTDKVLGFLNLYGGGKFEDVNVNLEINGRGTTGWYGSPKKSYNLKFENKESVCGMAKSKKWALRDNYHDRSLLRDRYVSYISQNILTNMGWQPSNTNCDFVLNGEYKGCYVLTERIKIEKDRLNIADISKVNNIVEGGFLCEVDERFGEKFHFRTTHGLNDYSGEKGIAICLKDPDDIDEETFGYIKGIVQTAENALYSDDFKNTENGYAHYFDVDALVDWYLIHEFVSLYDASSFYTSAYFYYNPKDGKIHMGPCWDYDTALRRSVTDLELRKINSWYRRLFEDERFCMLVKQRWREKKDELIHSISAIDKLADEIRVSANFNFMRWQVLGTPYEGLGWENLKSYQDQVDFMKDWATNRLSIMDEYINN